MEARGAETITTDLAMEWVTSMGRQPSWSIRLADVRCFARHLTHFDPLTEVPPSDAVPPARRTKPCIYSEIEIQALLAAALSLPPANALRRWTYHCLFGLIAVAGLRHSEALGLLRADVDLDQGAQVFARKLADMPRLGAHAGYKPRSLFRRRDAAAQSLTAVPFRVRGSCPTASRYRQD
ncbi:hypothetical protein [Sinorhizobium meliloti]|nr:hypothetical protein [Sinorhizobium meliloti]